MPMSDSVPSLLPAALAAAAAPEPLCAAFLGLAAQSAAGVVLKDATSGRVLWCDAAYAGLFGATPESLVGASEFDRLEGAQRSAAREADQALAGGGLPLPTQHRIERDGRRRDFMVTRAGVPGVDGAMLSLCRWSETTAQRETEQRLQTALGQIEAHQAAAVARAAQAVPGEQPLRDEVTGLYHRGQFEDLLRREVDLSLREHREFALAAIELDAFSAEAAARGAAAEERILEALGRLLRGNTRAMDASCRMDNRHFAVLLSGVGLATAHSRMEGMRRQCATQIIVLDGQNLGFTVSMGVASFPHTAHTQEELTASAEAALAEARRRGGNHVTLASIRFAGA
jgi:diguanylate cyclase (GGDEF)-like protein